RDALDERRELVAAAVCAALRGARARLLPRTQRVERDVTRDTDDPRTHRFAVAEARAPFDRAAQRLVRPVLHVRMLGALAKHARDDRAHERTEGGCLRRERAAL